MGVAIHIWAKSLFAYLLSGRVGVQTVVPSVQVSAQFLTLVVPIVQAQAFQLFVGVFPVVLAMLGVELYHPLQVASDVVVAPYGMGRVGMFRDGQPVYAFTQMVRQIDSIQTHYLIPHLPKMTADFIVHQIYDKVIPKPSCCFPSG